MSSFSPVRRKHPKHNKQSVTLFSKTTIKLQSSFGLKGNYKVQNDVASFQQVIQSIKQKEEMKGDANHTDNNFQKIGYIIST